MPTLKMYRKCFGLSHENQSPVDSPAAGQSICRKEILQPLAAMVAKIPVSDYFRSTRRTRIKPVVLHDSQIAVVDYAAVILLKSFAFFL
jgi:hypothetical protein